MILIKICAKQNLWTFMLVTALAVVSIGAAPAKAEVEATTIRVATSGSDNTSCGTLSQPCRTLQFAVNKSSSGDTLLVAGGTYTYNGAALQSNCYTTSIKPAVMCIVDKHLNIRGGYTPSNWVAPDPVSNPSIIDGQNTNRGIALIGTSPSSTRASLNLDGFTIRNGLAQGASSGADYQIGAYGGGMFTNSAAFTLKNVTFLHNRAIGGNTNQSWGGPGVGGGLGINLIPYGSTGILEQVTFDGNQALGGQGRDRGGSSLGGGLYIYSGVLSANYITFTNNLAQAGVTSGVGYDATGLSADGLGGGLAIHLNSQVVLQHLKGHGNTAIGGTAGNQAGHGHGGAVFTEYSTNVDLLDSEISGNLALGGNGQTGGIGGGGGVMSTNSALKIQRTYIVGNTARGGNGTGLKGSAGGGGLYFTRFQGNQVIWIGNTMVADNYIEQGSGPGDPGGGGGGIWAQGVALDITHSTIARNSMQPTLVYGSAAIFVNFSTPTPTAANISYSIISDHVNTNPNTPWLTQAALHVWNGNSLNLNKGLLANNTSNTNAGNSPPSPGGTGAINGLGTMLTANSVEYIAANNYHLTLQSPARDLANGSPSTQDVDGQSRPYSNVADVGFDEYHPFLVTISTGNNFLDLNWSHHSDQLKGGVDHYEILVTCPPGANPPREGACNSPIQADQSESFLLTGLSNFVQYTVVVNAKGANGITIANSNPVTAMPTNLKIFLPSIIR